MFKNMQNDHKQDRAHSNVSKKKKKIENQMNINRETVLQSVKCETISWIPDSCRNLQCPKKTFQMCIVPMKLASNITGKRFFKTFTSVLAHSWYNRQFDRRKLIADQLLQKDGKNYSRLRFEGEICSVDKTQLILFAYYLTALNV